MAKNDVIRVRVTPDTKKEIDRLATLYDMPTPDFVRRVFEFVASERPALIVRRPIKSTENGRVTA